MNVTETRIFKILHLTSHKDEEVRDLIKCSAKEFMIVIKYDVF